MREGRPGAPDPAEGRLRPLDGPGSTDHHSPALAREQSPCAALATAYVTDRGGTPRGVSPAPWRWSTHPRGWPRIGCSDASRGPVLWPRSLPRWPHRPPRARAPHLSPSAARAARPLLFGGRTALGHPAAHPGRARTLDPATDTTPAPEPGTGRRTPDQRQRPLPGRDALEERTERGSAARCWAWSTGGAPFLVPPGRLARGPRRGCASGPGHPVGPLVLCPKNVREKLHST